MYRIFNFIVRIVKQIRKPKCAYTKQIVHQMLSYTTDTVRTIQKLEATKMKILRRILLDSEGNCNIKERCGGFQEMSDWFQERREEWYVFVGRREIESSKRRWSEVLVEAAPEYIYK